ncbi:hypothetical protein [Opitutus sp. GAS368]|uniref:hypothetical protein n=1 Tax=Opitutus sp. GAS368 TaxID=1882749 RepID=UPI00087D9BAC|nr:hypothetical protein [Opitutus sp. GAS368]SDS63897.1 hypothetical protein SAMN05444173_3504 [Opitutus sp. GAS368]
MIAVVSSCVAPSVLPSHDGARTTLTPEVRLQHTRGTVDSLLALGVKQIFVTDNSAGSWLVDRAAELAPARIIPFTQPPIRNKGIGEMWLLLGVLQHLPENEPVLKISGRYRVGPATELKLREGDDVVGKLYVHGRVRSLSTRCYLMRDRAVAARLWERTLDEIYAEAARIHGPRSLLRILQSSLRPARDRLRYGDPTAAVETAIYHAIRHLSLRLREVEHLDVEGIMGSWINEVVTE